MLESLNDTEIYERMRPLLERVVPKGASSDNISSETSLREDLNVDSARLVELVLELEDAFRISIEDGLIEQLKTVGDLTALVKAKVA